MSTFEMLSLLFSGAAYIFYIVPILRSKTRPTVSTWISWLAMDIAVFAGMYSENIFSVQMMTYVIGSTVVIGICLFRNASLGWQRLDTICVLIVAAAIGMWLATGNALLGIALSLVASVVGSIPMLVNTWREPRNEAMPPWIVVLAGGVFQLLSLTEWTLASASASITFFFLQLAFIGLISKKFFLRPAQT